MEFAGGGAVGGRGLGGEEFGEQGGDVVRPGGVVVAARASGCPDLGLALGTGAEIVAVEFVEAGAGEAQFAGGGGGGQFAAAMAGQEMADERGGETVDQLQFFMSAKLEGAAGILRFETEPGRDAGPPRW